MMRSRPDDTYARVTRVMHGAILFLAVMLAAVLAFTYLGVR